MCFVYFSHVESSNTVLSSCGGSLKFEALFLWADFFPSWKHLFVPGGGVLQPISPPEGVFFLSGEETCDLMS